MAKEDTGDGCRADPEKVQAGLDWEHRQEASSLGHPSGPDFEATAQKGRVDGPGKTGDETPIAMQICRETGQKGRPRVDPVEKSRRWPVLTSLGKWF